ncbi:transposase [Zavarzinella formosa]|uniref:transposase n=1 Tax=Zavarzinella formosa TaxID=360055 RepID=UPI0002F1BF26|nr:transposase [Zavarzinella formosa]
MYEKLNHADPAVAEALVRDTAGRLRAVAEFLPACPDVINGLRLKQLDGNYLADTDRRLQELRGRGTAALPGLALVVRDDRTGLLTDLVACEDAYARERSLIERALTRVGSGELWVADRNFAVDALFAGIAAAGSFFVVRYHAGTILHELTPGSGGRSAAPADRYHAGTILHELTPRRPAGVTDTGLVFEQQVRVGKTTCRSVVLQLFRPTEDGDTDIRLLTNLSEARADAARVAETYRRRWRIEGAFLELTTSLRCEVNTLGYPKAVLLGFSLAVAACNVLRVVSAALEAAEQKGPNRTASRGRRRDSFRLLFSA